MCICIQTRLKTDTKDLNVYSHYTGIISASTLYILTHVLVARIRHKTVILTILDNNKLLMYELF